MATVYYTATTLDGFLADEHDNLDWLTSQPLDAADDSAFAYGTFLTRVGAIVMGSTTYRWVLDHDEWSYTMPAWIVSTRTLPRVEGDVRFVQGDVATMHADMVASAGGRDLWVVGGGDLAGQFADAGLLDEIIVSVAPVTLGAGRPLLPRPLELELLETHRNEGFACARYRVIGPLGHGVAAEATTP